MLSFYFMFDTGYLNFYIMFDTGYVKFLYYV